MKYRTTPSFLRDFKKLPDHHQDKFKHLLPAFNAAAEKAARGAANAWPKGMRVKPVRGAPNIWELTWSMNDSDGRATWEWTTIGGEAGILWRRVGGHGMVKKP